MLGSSTLGSSIFGRSILGSSTFGSSTFGSSIFGRLIFVDSLGSEASAVLPARSSLQPEGFPQPGQQGTPCAQSSTNTSTRCGGSAGSPRRQAGGYRRQESPQHEPVQKPPRRGSLPRARQNPCSAPAESAHYAPPACQNTRASRRDSGSRYREPADRRIVMLALAVQGALRMRRSILSQPPLLTIRQRTTLQQMRHLRHASHLLASAHSAPANPRANAQPGAKPPLTRTLQHD